MEPTSGSFDPASIEVFVGIDMAKGDHYAQAVSVLDGELFDRAVPNDETAINALIADARSTARWRWWSTSPRRAPSCCWRWPATPACPSRT